MNSFFLEKTYAILRGEQSSQLSIGSDKNINRDRVSICAIVKVAWCCAKIKFKITQQELEELKDGLSKIINRENNELDFINHEGNFNLMIKVTSSGLVTAQVIISPNMIDEEQLSCEFYSSLGDTSDFLDGIKSINNC